MKLLISGGTGLIGQAVIRQLADDQIVVLTRELKPSNVHRADHIIYTNNLASVDFNELDVVINLAGEPIADKRWSKKQKQRICQSRWQLTAQLSASILAANKPPKCFISGSAIGYYGRQGNNIINESGTTPHDEFSHQVCHQWEQLALQAQTAATRVCLLRTGIVLAKSSGALAKMLPAFRLGLGGPIGDGQQYMSWVHIDDMVNIILKIITDDTLTGTVNATAPNPVTNQVFAQTLSTALHRPCWLPMPKFIIKMLLGEMSDLLLYGQRVVPEKLLKQAMQFQYTKLDDALINLLDK